MVQLTVNRRWRRQSRPATCCAALRYRRPSISTRCGMPCTVPSTCAPAFIGAGLENLLGSLPEGVDEEEAWEAAVHPDDQAAYAEFGRTCQRGEPAEVEFRLVGYDGVTRWVWQWARPRIEAGVVYPSMGSWPTSASGGEPGRGVGAGRRRGLEHLAYHDPLTDLPNRLLFEEHLERRPAECRSQRWRGRGVVCGPERLQTRQRQPRPRRW